MGRVTLCYSKCCSGKWLYLVQEKPPNLGPQNHLGHFGKRQILRLLRVSSEIQISVEHGQREFYCKSDSMCSGFESHFLREPVNDCYNSFTNSLWWYVSLIYLWA